MHKMSERFQNPVEKSEKKAKSIPLSQLYHCTLSWLCTGTSIQHGGVKLVLWHQRSPLSKMMRSCKCYPHVSKMLILKDKRENSVSVKILNIMHINVQNNNYYAYLLYIYIYIYIYVLTLNKIYLLTYLGIVSKCDSFFFFQMKLVSFGSDHPPTPSK